MKVEILFLDDFAVIADTSEYTKNELCYFVDEFIEDWKKEKPIKEISTQDILDYLLDNGYILDYGCYEDGSKRIETNY